MDSTEVQDETTAALPPIPDDAPHPLATREAEAGGPLRPLAPAEALARLRKGETLRGFRIERLVLRDEIAHPVRLKDCVLVRPVFSKATFADEVSLRYCTIERPVCEKRITFARGLDLSGSSMVAAALRRLDVRKTFCADNLKARGKFVLADCHFAGPVRFWDAKFGGWVDVKSCTFDGEADFRSLDVDEGFNLMRCRFAGAFLFRGSSVAKKLDLTGSTFHGLVDLSKAKLHDFVYLEGIEVGPATRFAVRNAVAERILARVDHLAGRLASEEAGDHVGAMQEYGLLKRSFEGQHRYDDEDWAFYRFKINQRRASPRSWRRPWSKLGQFFDWLFLDLGCAYGTNPLRAVRGSLALIVAFALVYAAGIGLIHVDRVPIPGHGQSWWANRLLIGLQTSVAAFTSGFGDLRDAAEGWMTVPVIAEALLGTLIWGLFIVAFGRKVIR